MIVTMQGKYTTASGAPVRILCVDSEGLQPVVGIQGGNVWTWGLSGQFNVAGRESTMDLIEATPAPPTPLEAAARKTIEARSADVRGFAADHDALHAAIDDLAAALGEKS